MQRGTRCDGKMAEPPEKKPDASKPTEIRVLPMELQLGDRLLDKGAEWQVIGRPYSTAGGKTVHVRVESGPRRSAGRPHNLSYLACRHPHRPAALASSPCSSRSAIG